MPSQRTGFGPWSTALDNGTRMQLSAFWRRRMFGLGQLPMKRTSRRWLVLTGVAALLLGATPMLQFASDAAAEERADVEPTTAPPSAEATKLAADEGSQFLRKITQEAAPLLATLAEKRGYGLAPGEAVKRVAPPFPKERMEWYRVGQPGQAEAIPSGPDSMLFHWRDGKLHNWGMSFGGPGLEGIIRDVLGIYPQDIVGLKQVAGIKGDWIVDPQAPVEERLTQLQTILNEQAKVAIRLRFVEVERDVYVARGDYQFKPLPGQLAVDETQLTDRISRTDPIQVFGEDLFPDSGAGGGTGNWGEFLEWVGRWTGSPIVSEVATPPAGEVSWRLHEPSPYTDRQRQAAHKPELVLANITKQTGVRFAKEARKVRVLKVELDDAAATKPAGSGTQFAQFVSVPADEMSLEEALKIVRPAKGDRGEVSEEVERQATARIAREEQKLLVELVESGVFTLKPGELVRFVPASESGEARRQLAQLSDDKRRIFLFFKPPAGEVPSLSGGKYDDMSLMDAITDVLGLPIQQVEGLDQTLAQELPEGDWLCSWDRSLNRAPLDDQLVAAFEKTLKGVLKKPVSLSIAFKELPVLIATGAYQANPIIDEKWSIPALSPEVAKNADGPFSFPARRGTTINMVSDFQGMLEMVGGLLLKPIINKADPGPTKESYFMSFAEPPQVDLHEPLDEAAAQAVIEAFQKQTSLQLTPARQEVGILVVGDAKQD